MLGIMKAFTGLGGLLILVIGLAMLGVTIWAFTQSQLLFNNYTFLGIVLGFDLLVIFASVIGICGIKRQSGPMLCIFQLFVMLFFFAFLSFGITSEVLPGVLFSGNCTNSDNTIIATAYNASTYGKLLCSPACPCGLKKESLDKGNYTNFQKAVINDFAKINLNGPVRFQQCDIAEALEKQTKDLFIVLQSIQKALDCTGWCSVNPPWLLYTFSDVNRGKPLSTCYDTMKQKVNQFGGVVGIAAFISAVFMLLVSICGLCICCAPDRRSQPMASRFIVNDGGYYRPV